MIILVGSIMKNRFYGSSTLVVVNTSHVHKFLLNSYNTAYFLLSVTINNKIIYGRYFFQGTYVYSSKNTIKQ